LFYLILAFFSPFSLPSNMEDRIWAGGWGEEMAGERDCL